MTTTRSIAGAPRASRGERACLAFLGVALAAAIALPAIPQDPAYHAFADQRTLFGVPRAADVLSSLLFALVGVAAVVRLCSSDRPRFVPVVEASLWCVAIALVFTGAGSVAYHLDPRDATLVWDRLPMTLGFAGVLSLALAQRVSARAGAVALPILVVLGAASVGWWHASGNIVPYGIVQYGSAAALVLLVATTSRDGDPFPWGWLIAWYAIAKVCEVGDARIHEATDGLVAGHAIKHVTAAAAGAALLGPLRRRGRVSRPT